MAAVVPVVPIPALASLNEALKAMGFQEEAANSLTDITKESMTMESLSFYDEKSVKSLCASLRRPGGLVDGLPDVNGVIKKVLDPGVYVSTRAEFHLATSCYMARHFERTSRKMGAGDIVIGNITRFAQLWKAEQAYKEPNEKLTLANPQKIIDFIDDWPESLAQFNGQNGRPLSYIIRENVVCLYEAFDPQYPLPGCIYASMRDEVNARAPHGSDAYMVDNALVFELLSEAVNDHKNVKTWIKPYAKTRNGREAWLAFKRHFRGSNEIEAIEVAAEKALSTLVYRGEKSRYNFEIHVSKHQKAHLDIAKTTGTKVPEARKVRLLLSSIQCASFNVPIACIRGHAAHKESFDESINYLRTWITNNEVAEVRNVSEFKVQKQKPKLNKRKNKSTNNQDTKKNKGFDRYYTPEEWKELDNETKIKVIKARTARKVASLTSDVTTESDVKVTSTSQREVSRK